MMSAGSLGKIYHNGEVIVRQGDPGDCMYVIQAGEVEILQEAEGKAVRLGVIGSGDFFGEMALFEREVRSATVRALGEARVLTLDKKTFLRRVHADPSLAYRLLQNMSKRIRRLGSDLIQVKEQAQSVSDPPLSRQPSEVNRPPQMD